MAIQVQKCPKTVEASEISNTNVNLCQRCGNTYVIVWLRQGRNFNDFGDRYCPFCGLLVDEFTGSIVE